MARKAKGLILKTGSLCVDERHSGTAVVLCVTPSPHSPSRLWMRCRFLFFLDHGRWWKKSAAKPSPKQQEDTQQKGRRVAGIIGALRCCDCTHRLCLQCLQKRLACWLTLALPFSLLFPDVLIFIAATRAAPQTLCDQGVCVCVWLWWEVRAFGDEC